ncbi:YkgJ family cysteine cluster protein [Desulfotomaculum defluvii]
MSKNLKSTDKFYFSCHDGLACFKQCCRDINIFLTPYDVLRLKQYLGMASEKFIEKHTHVLWAPGSGFPVVILKMREDNLVCPFITDYGCKVYQVRPWSCRMAPVEVRAQDIYGIAFEKSRCHGLTENKEWTVKEWMENQGLSDYEEPEESFAQIPMKIKLTGDKDLDQSIMKMIFIGCYNLDKFRKILMTNPELTQDAEPPFDLNDDLSLMKFAFKWLPEQLNDRKQLESIKLIINK